MILKNLWNDRRISKSHIFLYTVNYQLKYTSFKLGVLFNLNVVNTKIGFITSCIIIISILSLKIKYNTTNPDGFIQIRCASYANGYWYISTNCKATIASLSTFHPDANPAIVANDLYMKSKSKEPTSADLHQNKRAEGARQKAVFRMIGNILII